MIPKIQKNRDNYFFNEFFYDRARDAMFDIVNNLNKLGFKDIFIPGYIGWSPKEGSGIFDPINSISNLTRHYYLMTKNLYIDIDYLQKNIQEHSILLVVNYFGFRDPYLEEIIKFAHEKGCVVIEDNAHGFYTYHLTRKLESDFSFFSLHKMFPFEKGGSFILNNNKYRNLPFTGVTSPLNNPYQYDIYSIAQKRKENFKLLYSLLEEHSEFLRPLKSTKDILNNVPQTFPIVLLQGDRNLVYEKMNSMGYGVVSLYHTLIDELQNEKYAEAVFLSKNIMNLPLHQDVNSLEYSKMISTLINCIKEN